MEDAANSSGYSTPYKFTGKELDKETGLYYYGARYYDARISRWVSADPALQEGKYFPKPQDYDTEHDFYWYILNDASGKLPGMGGVYNSGNLDVYCYALNNPVKYFDPDGKTNKDKSTINSDDTKKVKENTQDSLLATRIRQNDPRLKDPAAKSACFYRSLQSIAESYAGKNLTSEQINEATESLIESGNIESNYYVNDAKAVIIDSLKRLGINTDKLFIDYKRDIKELPKEGVTATILYGSRHFQHGDSKGNLVWDPANGTVPYTKGPIDRIDAITIRKKEE